MGSSKREPTGNLVVDDLDVVKEKPSSEGRYCQLLVIHIISLAVTCMLLVVSIIKTNQAIDLVKDTKKDIIRYLNDAEISIIRDLNGHATVLKLEITSAIEKNQTGRNLQNPDQTRERESVNPNRLGIYTY